jgi:hypothetical protein
MTLIRGMMNNDETIFEKVVDRKTIEKDVFIIITIGKRATSFLTNLIFFLNQIL